MELTVGTFYSFLELYLILEVNEVLGLLLYLGGHLSTVAL